MATIKEIAELSGASRGTVDRVIHNRGRVAPDVEKAVRAAIEKLDYKPNKAGRILASAKRIRHIGAVIQSNENRFFIDVEKGMEHACHEVSGSGFDLVIKRVRGFGIADNLAAVKELADSGIDALIVTVPDSEEICSYLSTLSLPIAALNSNLSLPSLLYYVGPDYFRKGEINAGLLAIASKEMPRILILSGSDSMQGHRDIVRGFISALDSRHIPYEIEAEVFAEDDNDRAEKLVREAISQHPEINAVFISTGGAEGALRAIEDRHLTVFASDVVDDVREGIREGKILWTVSQEPFRQGYEAVKRMQDYFIEGKRPDSLYINQIVRISENIDEE